MAISETKIGGKLVLITIRTSYMRFRLVPKSMTWNDLERRNGPFLRYFTEFVYIVVVKQLPRFQNLLLIVYMTILVRSAQLFSDYLGKINSDNSV